MNTHAIPEALPRIRAAIDAGILSSGSWGDGATAVCMMSAAVTGAQSTDDCVTKGWPLWLAELNVALFDRTVGADDEAKARNHFALDVAGAVSVPRDFDKARDLFLIATLERSKVHDTANVTQPVIDLLRRRIAGEDVADEMKTAADAAVYAAAADAVADAAAYAAYAAAAAADAAAAYAAAAAADAAAAYAAAAAADAAAAYAADAGDAARADARAALINAIRQS